MPTKQRLIDSYQKSTFSFEVEGGHEISHDVYSRGEGPPVVLIQELPGLGVETFRLAEKFIEQGFSVFMPHLFGPIGKTNIAGNLLRVFCMRKEFSLFAKNKTSPVTAWLRALCRSIKAQQNAPGVGVIGMCLTGNFAISLMADESVVAAVSSQPAMPFFTQRALHMSDSDIQAIKDNIDATAPIKAFQFERDPLSSKEKFACINDTFNSDRERVQLNRLPGSKHSVLTLDFVDKEGHPTHSALLDILAYFKQQLKV